MINKKEISEALALSCVESYFLAWLGKYYDVSNLYGHSFISLKQAFDDFSHGAMYQNYCYLPRLQDIKSIHRNSQAQFLPKYRHCQSVNVIRTRKFICLAHCCVLRTENST